ncbi:response regulator [Herminiimonas aquatilis]|uniref:Response regulator transcription factor n=1 Tax=Herminiimonas aquatilis TaxID=345342 RepID=A0ABW2J304_9BURK
MNIALVDDSTMVRANLTSLLTKLPGVHVVGHAASEDEAVALINLKLPDLVLMDISLERGTGLDALRRIRLTGNASRVWMLSNHTASRYRELGNQLGAEEFFDKGIELEQLVAEIKNNL